PEVRRQRARTACPRMGEAQTMSDQMHPGEGTQHAQKACERELPLLPVLKAADASVAQRDVDHPAVDELLHGAYVDHCAETRGSLTHIEDRRGRCERVVEQSEFPQFTAFRQVQA